MGCGGFGFSGANMVGPWEKVSFTHVQFQAAALANNIQAFSLLAKQNVHAFKVVPTIQFAGPGITNYQISVGIATALQKWVLNFSVNVAPGGTVFAEGGPYTDMIDTGAATSVRIAATATGANLNVSTAGALDLYFLRSLLP